MPEQVGFPPTRYIVVELSFPDDIGYEEFIREYDQWAKGRAITEQRLTNFIKDVLQHYINTKISEDPEYLP